MKKSVISVCIDDEILKQLDVVSKDFGISRSSMLSLMIGFFLKSQSLAQSK